MFPQFLLTFPSWWSVGRNSSGWGRGVFVPGQWGCRFPRLQRLPGTAAGCPAGQHPEAGLLPTNGLPFVSPGLVQIPVSMYQTVVTSLAQGNGPVQVAMAPVATRISDSTVTMDGQAVEVVTLEQ